MYICTYTYRMYQVLLSPFQLYKCTYKKIRILQIRMWLNIQYCTKGNFGAKILGEEVLSLTEKVLANSSPIAIQFKGPHFCMMHGYHEYTVYDKTFEGENFRGFRGFGSTANVFPRIFPSK